MAGFDEAWGLIARSYDGEFVSPELRPLLQQLYSDILDKPVIPLNLKSSIVELLEYLNRRGRTNANCWAVDLFFCLSESWELDWTEQSLPEDFHEVLALMAEALHDTVKSPEIAENFGCLPEQLLARARLLKCSDLAADC